MEKIGTINHMDGYLHRMHKSVLDKLFFADKIFSPYEYLVDFGCANGELIKHLQLLLDDVKFIGYDISQEMIAEAKVNIPNVRFELDWNKIDIDKSKALLNISSTIHEVYSYGDSEDVELFWERVFNSGFKYIAIRDMCTAKEDDNPVPKAILKTVRGNLKYQNELSSFESIWGEIKNYRELIHYFLKYTYSQNWDRESKENYLPIYKEELLKKIPQNYEVVYYEHYVLPYKRWEVGKDFGIDIDKPTHIKLILKKIG